MDLPMRLSRRAFLAGSTVAVAAWPASAAGRLSVVATTGMIADAARAVGGDLVEVRALMGPGVDPHAYRQTRSDISAMLGADLVLWHGLALEAQMERFLADLARRRPVVAIAESLPRNLLLLANEERPDPHVWMDPALWAEAVGAVQAALAMELPDHAQTLADAADAHLAEIARVAAYARETLATVPEGARVLVTAHDAFGYFGRAYGFEVVGIQGISTESEAGLNRIGALVETLVSRRIGAVFVESSVSDRNVRALIEGAAAQGHTVRIGGELFSDAMGPPGTYEGTWIGMIDHNVTTIAGALGGRVPARGMDGRLSAGL
jgi:manganese/zinc/iron transport system substrate-binding protein